jgi:hypothetical protein
MLETEFEPVRQLFLRVRPERSMRGSFEVAQSHSSADSKASHGDRGVLKSFIGKFDWFIFLLQ